MAELTMPPGGGFDYVQSTRPGGEQGESWFDTSDDLLYVHTGNGWSPVTPVYVTDESTTFDGSQSTVTTTETQVNGGSVDLVDHFTSTASWVQEDTYSTSTDWGVAFNPNADLYRVDVYVHGQTGNYDGVRITRASDNTTIAEETGSFSGGTWHSLTASLSSGTTYTANVITDSGIAQARNMSAYFDYTSTYVDITSGSPGHGDTGHSDAFNMTDIQGYRRNFDGSAVVEWGAPTDIETWDVATADYTLDGASVTVDVEDANGTVLKSDIGTLAELSDISPSKNVQLRVKLSRTKASQNPTLDYIARRYIR